NCKERKKKKKKKKKNGVANLVVGDGHCSHHCGGASSCGDCIAVHGSVPCHNEPVRLGGARCDLLPFGNCCGGVQHVCLSFHEWSSQIHLWHGRLEQAESSSHQKRTIGNLYLYK